MWANWEGIACPYRAGIRVHENDGRGNRIGVVDAGALRHQFIATEKGARAGAELSKTLSPLRRGWGLLIDGAKQFMEAKPW